MLQKLEPCVSCGFEFGGTPPVWDAQQMQLRVADITTNKEEAFRHGARSSHVLDLAGCCVWSWAYLLVGSLQQALPWGTGSLLWPPLFLCSWVTHSENSAGSCSLGWRKLPSLLLFSLLVAHWGLYFTHRLNPENLLYKYTQWQAVSLWLCHRHGRRQPCFWRCWWAPWSCCPGDTVYRTLIHHCRSKHTFYNDTLSLYHPYKTYFISFVGATLARASSYLP